MNIKKVFYYAPFIVLLMISLADANVVGTDAQNFNPTFDGLDYVTVHSSESLLPGYVNLGIFANYAINTFPYVGSGGGNQNLTSFNDYLISFDFNMGVGLTERWSAGLSLPFILTQGVASSTNLGVVTDSGFSEYRVSTKYHLHKGEVWGWAMIASVGQNRILNNPFVGIGGGPNVNLEFAADRKIFKTSHLAINLGHRWRNPGAPITSTGISPIPNQLIASAAISRHLPDWDLKLILELFGSYPLEARDTTADRQVASLESLVGFKYDYSSELAMHFGGGTELLHGTGTADWRIYTGLNWNFGPHFASVTDFDKLLLGTDELWIMSDLNFDTNSATLDFSSQVRLQRVVEQLRRVGEFKKLVIEGHTDSIGPAEYNLQLSQRRADTVKDELIKLYPSIRGKVRTIGYGESQPIADNGNHRGRTRNRRVTLRISR